MGDECESAYLCRACQARSGLPGTRDTALSQEDEPSNPSEGRREGRGGQRRDAHQGQENQRRTLPFLVVSCPTCAARLSRVMSVVECGRDVSRPLDHLTRPAGKEKKGGETIREAEGTNTRGPTSSSGGTDVCCRGSVGGRQRSGVDCAVLCCRCVVLCSCAVCRQAGWLARWLVCWLADKTSPRKLALLFCLPERQIDVAQPNRQTRRKILSTSFKIPGLKIKKKKGCERENETARCSGIETGKQTRQPWAVSWAGFPTSSRFSEGKGPRISSEVQGWGVGEYWIALGFGELSLMGGPLGSRAG